MKKTTIAVIASLLLGILCFPWKAEARIRVIGSSMFIHAAMDGGGVNWYKGYVDLAAKARIRKINLVCDWADLEPQRNVYDYDSVDQAIGYARSKDLKVILRIYANSGEVKQSSPSWLFDEAGAEFYSSGEGRPKKPLPWHPVYQREFSQLIRRFAKHWENHREKAPHYMQVSVGGVFGEQILEGYESGLPYEGFLRKLFAAEKWHLAMYSRYFAPSKLILMVNHLYGHPETEDTIALNDDVPRYAHGLGLRIFQTNAGTKALLTEYWGERTLAMLKRCAQMGTVVLEDEKGGRTGAGDAAEALSERFDRLKALEQQGGFRFRGFSICEEDLKGRNKADTRATIPELNHYLATP